MSEPLYCFARRIAKKIDYFAYPRTGSHYLLTCLSGLFDLVWYENEHTRAEEPAQRAKELNPMARYALSLREEEVAFHPVHIDTDPNGMHGAPRYSGNPVMTLIRDPYPAVYSLYKTASDRWGLKVDDLESWIQTQFTSYVEFYTTALAVEANPVASSLLVRFERLKEDVAELERIAAFVEVQPKLSCDYVHHWTSFERMTIPGKRTFYRQGDNSHWKKDKEWVAALEKASPPSFSQFGYQ